MGRERRQHEEGGLYHIIARGNRKQPIFLDDQDRHYFLGRLQKCLEGSDCRLYAYVLMNNHFHLLLRAGKQPLWRLMHSLLLSYARYFNVRHGLSGHLFQGPYRSLRCERESHLLELVRYLHLNPVRAGLCDAPSEHPWSSHSDYRRAKGPKWIHVEEALQLFGKDPARAARAYAKFVADGLKMGHRADLYPTPRGPAAAARPQQRPPSRAVLERLCKSLGVDAAEVLGPTRTASASRARALLAYLLVRRLGLPPLQVAGLLRRHPSAISRALRMAEEILNADPSARAALAALSPTTQS